MRRLWLRAALAIGATFAVLGVAAGTAGTGDTATTQAAAASSATTGADVTSGDLGLPDGGVIRLRIDGISGSNPGAQNWFRHDAPDGSGGYTPGVPAPISVQSCIATTSGVMDVTAAPNNGKLGLFETGLGVQVPNEGRGIPCGRVDGLAQALTLEPAIPGSAALFDFAELDIEGKFGVTVRAELYLGDTLAGVETLATGAADSGPDSGDGDNFRWRIPAADAPLTLFDRLVLRVDPSTPSGAFSLEGGGDGTAAEPGGLGEALGTTDTLFHLVDADGTIGCGGEASAGGDGTPGAEVARLDNLLGDSGDCKPIPYALRTGTDGGIQSVLLAKELGEQADLMPAFTLAITWEPEPAEYPLGRTTEIDSGDGPAPLQWCDGSTAEPVPPEGQVWCLAHQSTEVVGDGLIAVTESLYGAGDPRFTR
jgi:hypothetical protein